MSFLLDAVHFTYFQLWEIRGYNEGKETKLTKKFTILSFATAFPLGLFVALGMNSAKDRENYISFLEDPFAQTRFEPGFKFIGKMLYYVSTPEISIVLISVATYLLLAFSWERIYEGGYIGSFLSFHLSAYMFFNYYLGTAIRNGLAAAIIIAIFTLVGTKGSQVARALILIGPAFHLGTALFSMLGWFYAQTHRFKHGLVIALFTSVVAIFSFNLILPLYMTDPYYSLWLKSGSFGTERFRSFAMLVYALFILLVVSKPRKDFWTGVVLVPAPLLVFYFVTGLEAFHRLLMPFFFVSAAVVFQRYAPTLGSNLGKQTYFFILLSGNFAGLSYACKQWGIL